MSGRELAGPQHQVLDYIKRYRTQWQMPPTRAEIAKAQGYKSVNAAQDVPIALERKGFISILDGRACGIFVY